MSINYHDLKVPDNSTNYITVEPSSVPYAGQEGLLVGDKFIGLGSVDGLDPDYFYTDQENQKLSTTKPVVEVWQCIDHLRLNESDKDIPIFDAKSTYVAESPLLKDELDYFFEVAMDEYGLETKIMELTVPICIETTANVSLSDQWFDNFDKEADYFRWEEGREWLVDPFNSKVTNHWHLKAIKIDKVKGIVTDALYMVGDGAGDCFHVFSGVSEAGDGSKHRSIRDYQLKTWAEYILNRDSRNTAYILLSQANIEVRIYLPLNGGDWIWESFYSSDFTIDSVSKGVGEATVGGFRTELIGNMPAHTLNGTVAITTRCGGYVFARSASHRREYVYRHKASPVFVRLSGYPTPGEPSKRTQYGTRLGLTSKMTWYDPPSYSMHDMCRELAVGGRVCPHLTIFYAPSYSFLSYVSATSAYSDHLLSLYRDYGRDDLRIPADVYLPMLPSVVVSESFDGGRSFDKAVDNSTTLYYASNSEIDIYSIQVGDVFTARLTDTQAPRVYPKRRGRSVELKQYCSADDIYLASSPEDELFTTAPINYNADRAKNMLADGQVVLFGSSPLEFADPSNPSLTNVAFASENISTNLLGGSFGFTVAFNISAVSGGVDLVPICQLCSVCGLGRFTIALDGHRNIYMVDSRGATRLLTQIKHETDKYKLCTVACKMEQYSLGSSESYTGYRLVVFVYTKGVNINPTVKRFACVYSDSEVSDSEADIFYVDRSNSNVPNGGYTVTLFSSVDCPNTLNTVVELDRLYITGTYDENLERYA